MQLYRPSGKNKLGVSFHRVSWVSTLKMKTWTICSKHRLLWHYHLIIICIHNLYTASFFYFKHVIYNRLHPWSILPMQRTSKLCHSSSYVTTNTQREGGRKGGSVPKPCDRWKTEVLSNPHTHCSVHIMSNWYTGCPIRTEFPWQKKEPSNLCDCISH